MLPGHLKNKYAPNHRNNSTKKEISNEEDKFKRLLVQIEASHLLLDASTGWRVKRRNTSSVKRTIDNRVSLGTRGRSDIGSNEFCEIRVLGDPDDETEYPEVYAIVKTPRDPKALNELKALGVEPEEAENPFEFIFVRHQSMPVYAQVFNEALRARGASKRIELQNQFLPLSSQRLTDQDLSQFVRFLKTLEGKGNSYLALLLRVIFATSSSIERAINLQITTRDKFKVRSETVGYDLEVKEWLIPVFPLNLKTVYKQEAMGHCREAEASYLSVPDHFGFHRKLIKLFGEQIPERPFLRLFKAKR